MKPVARFITEGLDQLENIYTALRVNNITVSKTMAMKIVGGRGILERLVATKKIRTKNGIKPGKFNRWECFAEDVFRYANYKKKSPILKQKTNRI